MKKFFTIMLVVLMAFSAISCAAPANVPSASPTADAKADYSVALIMAGPISDHGWNAMAYASLEKMKTELGVKTAYQESVAQSDYEEVFRNFAQEGYNIIIGHGYEFGDAAKIVAKDYPKLYFAVTSTDISMEPNVAAINNDTEQQGFLAGAFAALMTKSNIIGVVTGMNIPSIQGYTVGFYNGAEYVKPGVDVRVISTGDFTNAAKAKETAGALIDAGADIIAHNADSAGLGVIEAAKNAGLPCMGAITDQYKLAPDTIMVSALSDLSEAIFVFVKNVTEGKFEAKSFNFGIVEGCVGLSSYHNFEDKVPQEVTDKVAEISKGIVDGTIDPTKGPGSVS